MEETIKKNGRGMEEQCSTGKKDGGTVLDGGRMKERQCSIERVRNDGETTGAQTDR